MDVWTSLTEGEQSGVWVAFSGAFVLFALIIYPLLYRLKKRKFRKQISNHLVTTTYKLPDDLTPAELSYLFSPKINKKHIFASLMQLVNDGVLVASTNQGRLMLSIGPRVNSRMSLSSAYAIDTIDNGGQTGLDVLINGNTSYKIPNTQQKIEGSRVYVFWWLIREGLRQRGVIVKHPVKSYFSVIFKTLFRVYGLSLVFVLALHTLLMMLQGEIDFVATQRIVTSGLLWLVLFFPMLFIISFVSVRIRGRLLGRDWILTDKKQRLLNQFDAYREYVRLVQEGNVTFENGDARKDAQLRTLPYAVALGFAKVPARYTTET